MKIYIASHDQKQAREVANICAKAGHTITSRWLDEEMLPSKVYTHKVKETIAIRDKYDVDIADAVVLISSRHLVPGGKFVEAGIALGLGKMVYVIGKRENMLLWYPSVQQYDTIEKFLDMWNKRS